MKVAVLGLGYVGCVTAAGLASHGHHVVGVDIDTSKVEAVLDGRSPVVEPGLAELIAENISTGRLTATRDLHSAIDGADVSVVCVGTPSQLHGAADLTFVHRIVADVRTAMMTSRPPASGRHVIMVRSTVPPGTCDGLAAGELRAESIAAGWQVAVAMCPEFLREGTGLRDFDAAPFVVIGTAQDWAADVVRDLFSFIDCPIEHVDIRTAEALKYACNAFHATKVSFTNEISRVFREYGVDSRTVMKLFCEDKTLNISTAYLRPGFAYGGSCLPKDLRSLVYLARNAGIDVPLLTGVAATNDLVVRDAVDRVIASGARRVALFGLSFKSSSDDLRESPSVELAERLVGKGIDLQIYDPIVNFRTLVGANRRHVEDRLPHLARLLRSTPGAALDGCELVVMATTDTRARAALVQTDPMHVLDLTGSLGAELEGRPSYEGLAW